MTSGNGDPSQRTPAESGTEWLRAQGPDADVVMSSRVRFARNLAGFPFMPKASESDRLHILHQCKERIMGSGLADRLMWLDLHETPTVERMLLVERHLISQQHARGRLSDGSGGPGEPRGVAVSVPDERLSVMVNEEDHLRIQVIRAGLALDDALTAIDEIDDKLEQTLDYAFSPRFGYMTACPTNVGTAARFSVMVHLPALKVIGDLEKVKRAAADMSLAVRGFYGEGSEAAGDFYQISNQTTLGKPESVLMHELAEEILPKVIDYERTSRNRLLSKQRSTLEDRVHRAYGTLTHARLVTTEESMELLSLVRLGVVLGLIEGVDLQVVNRLMLLVQPAHLQRLIGESLSQDQRRGARASLLRSRLGPRPDGSQAG